MEKHLILTKKNPQTKKEWGLIKMGRRWDLNPRPLEPQSSALTN